MQRRVLLLALVLGGCTHQTAFDFSSRPLDLVAAMAASPLKDQLMACAELPIEPTRFAIAHRGAPLGYPEHTEEGYRAAARMGAGVIECDVTFTKDRTLVCRHSQCDLHSTTNILQTPLAARCTEPFTPASHTQGATARCCTSDLTLNEFKSLCGRRDIVDRNARSIDEYLIDPPTVVSAPPVACGTLVTQAESIELFDELGVDFIPELKRPEVAMPYQGTFTQTLYADKMLNEYRSAGIEPDRVHPQSFDIRDVEYWLQVHPEFAANVVYLDPRGRDPNFEASLEDMRALYSRGVRTLAPPMPMLLTLSADGELAASDYAIFARQAGLDLVTWTFESGKATDPANWLYANLPGFVTSEDKMLDVLHALTTKAEIKGIFTDWPGTVTYYANCLLP